MGKTKRESRIRMGSRNVARIKREMRWMYVAGGWSQADLAYVFSVSKTTVGRILTAEDREKRRKMQELTEKERGRVIAEARPLRLTKPDKALLHWFTWDHLKLDPDRDKEPWPEAREDCIWLETGLTGTGMEKLIYWYRNIHQPGSEEGRPAIILRAALRVGIVAGLLTDADN